MQFESFPQWFLQFRGDFQNLHEKWDIMVNNSHWMDIELRSKSVAHMQKKSNMAYGFQFSLRKFRFRISRMASLHSSNRALSFECNRMYLSILDLLFPSSEDQNQIRMELAFLG